MTIDLPHALSIARAVALRAGEELKQAHKRLVSGSETLAIKTKSNESDFVTQVDGMIQELVVSELHKAFPEHRFFAEEEGADAIGDSTCPYEWIIDPLDGTTNFIHRKPTFGSLLSLWDGTDMLLGIIVRPMFNEIYEGVKGHGASFNGAPITLRATKGMADATVCSNLMRRAEQSNDGTWRISTPKVGNLENYGNAAQEIGEVLRGWNDGVFFDGVGLWDAAPGLCLVPEAGGKAWWEWKDRTDRRKGIRCVIATEPIFDALCVFMQNR